MLRALLLSGLFLYAACGGTAAPTPDGGGTVWVGHRDGGDATDGGDAVDGGDGTDGGNDSDAGMGSDAGSDPDAGVDGGTVPTENEPNDGNPTTNALTAPATVAGAIGTANDVDVFMVDLTVGDQWKWSLDARGSAMTPHLTIMESANSVPIVVARGPAGGSARIEQLVLKTGSYAVIIRDSNNVPAKTSKNVGSPSHTWELRGEPSTRAALPLPVPGVVSGSLADPWDSALHGFTLTTSTQVTLEIKARTKSPATDLDTRLTLFNASMNLWMGTNDDQTAANTDSLLTGPLPPGDYRVLVENLDESATSLGFEVTATSP